MTLPSPESHADWRQADNIEAVVAHLRAFAQSAESIDIDALSANPFAVMGENPAVRVKVDQAMSGEGCSVFGHYSSTPTPTITVRATSTVGRDEFTLLHEYAHHLQQHDPDWVDIWSCMPKATYGPLNEAIADEFASSVLIPDPTLGSVITGLPTATQLADLYLSTQASRQAVLVRAAKTARRLTTREGIPREHGFLLLATYDGEVVFSQLVGDEIYPPSRGSHQPDIAAIAARSSGSATHAVTSHGISYGSGAARHDVRLDLHPLDDTYVYVVGTREHRYGTPQWSRATRECSNETCDPFDVTELIATCRSCKAARCPTCASCDCEPAKVTACTCCFQVLLPAELSAGRTVHLDCE
ncbi:ImmA/IrrE family metallo-endopeptidase [Nocardioides sp. Bht2]|uniref:ImmA/IrrE family metallo-endopeptidase n=1 Tax=Nocardioides sp. Bht2 TaxID=3392297 RepID=UPI0039B6D44B